jgi:hypothetical protein
VGFLFIEIKTAYLQPPQEGADAASFLLQDFLLLSLEQDFLSSHFELEHLAFEHSDALS